VTALGGDPMGSLGTLAISRMLLGDWDAALDEGNRIRERFGDSPPGFLRVAWAVTEYLLASRGQFAEAESLRSLRMGTPMRLSYRALGLAAEGRMDEAWAQFPLAVNAIGVAFEQLARARLLQMSALYPELAAASARIRERAERIGGWVPGLATADRADAAIDLAGGDASGAAALARRSVAGFEAAGAEWEAAVSRLDLADALAALGDAAEIPVLLAEAEGPLQRAGALAELARWDALAAGILGA
jgi:hypothetical protein